MSDPVEVGYIVGSDGDETIVLDRRANIPYSGNTDILKLQPDGIRFRRIHMAKNYFRRPFRIKFDRYETLINLVTDADANRRVLDTLEKALKGFSGRVINHPKDVAATTRDGVWTRLRDLAEIICPVSVRIGASTPAMADRILDASGMTFPAILRRPGTHTGDIVGVLAERSELWPHLGRAREYLLTSFVDARSGDGLCRKFRFFFFGQHAVMRHMLVSDGWNVHAQDRLRYMAGRPQLLEEERSVLEGGIAGLAESARAGLEAIRRRHPLDFFGLDCGIAADGRIIVFEANATMNFFPFSDDPDFSYVKSCIPPARDALRHLVLPARNA